MKSRLAPAPAASPERPTTLAQVNEALAVLDQQRAGHMAEIRAYAEREQALIEADAPDDELDRLSRDHRRHKHRLQRLSIDEERLVALAAELEEREHAAAWADILDKNVVACKAIDDAIAHLSRARADYVALINYSQKLGFSERAGHNFLEWLPEMKVPPATDFEGGAVSRRNRGYFKKNPEKTTYTVHFLKWTSVVLTSGGGHMIQTAYQKGQFAGFSAEKAHDLVNGGHAEWCDRIPPDPRKKLATPPASGANT